MASTTVATGLRVAQFSEKYFEEWINDSRYARYMSESGDNVIYVNKELGKKAGDNITCGIFGDLSEPAIENDDELDNNEEAMDNASDTLTINQYRKAVEVRGMEEKRTVYDLPTIARSRLLKWSKYHLHTQITDRLVTFNLDGITTYAASTEVEKDAALAANTDRVLFGQLLSNRSTTDHSASLANIDTTDDTHDSDIMGLAARIAETADPKITPLTFSEDEFWWVQFFGPNVYRDLKASLDAVHQNAGPRDMKENPVWRAGDLVHGAVIGRKILEMTSIGAVGLLAAPVYTVVHCGQNAAWLAWGQMPIPLKNGPYQDYGNKKGVGIQDRRGAKKVVGQGSTFYGCVQVYVAAAADA